MLSSTRVHFQQVRAESPMLAFTPGQHPGVMITRHNGAL
nr:MAG TPA_asm: hypothetical protein [Caudoviricetes sp.]